MRVSFVCLARRGLWFQAGPWLVALLVGCVHRSVMAPPVSAGPAAHPAVASAAVPYVPMQRWQWHLHWAGMQVGQLTLDVSPSWQQDGRAVVQVRSRWQSRGMLRLIGSPRGEEEALFGLHSPVPLDSHGYQKRRGQWRRVEARFAPGGFALRIAKSGAAPLTWDGTLPARAQPHNLHSMLALARGVARSTASTTGRHFLIYNGRLYGVRLQRRDRSRVEQGRQAVAVDLYATRLLPDLKPKPGKKRQHLTAWVSADVDRLPLKLEAHSTWGKVTATLRH